MTERYDAIIVGCGPAGASAARVIAAAGHRVLVVERKEVIGEPNHCGEGVSHDCLLEAGLPPPQPWIVREVAGCRLVFPNRATVVFPRRGYCIRRPAFDRALAELAMAAGAEVRCATRFEEASLDDDRWWVSTSRGPVQASYLIGAGGPTCTVARQLGGAPEVIAAVQYKFPARAVAQPAGDWLSFHHDEAFPGGYGWVFHRGEEVSVGAGCVGPPRGKLDAFCRSLGLDPDVRSDRAGGLLPFLPRPSRLVFPRALLCGDAGGFTHPFTKGGVHGAVWSGRAAGETVREAVECGDPGRLAGFASRVRGHPARDPGHLRLPRAFLRFDNDILSTIGSIMDGRSHRDVPLLACLRHLARRPRPRLLWGVSVGLAVQRRYRRSERFAW